ncbi:hypothetical protein [Stieleria varia]|uniref:Oxidative stress defense protein n=1 Tax=Stieleria varia TaxID=2528005 RepID=A0A5C6A4L4_9BACT|nr:hypothetical protein [Stieleria varia]TWT94409.1 hypothetical protein Pla52n_52300 [Stieleria varia]
MNTTLRNLIFPAAMLLCTPALAQYSAMGGSDLGLTALGTKQLSLTPQWLEMSIEIEGRSSDLPQASKELKRRVETAKERLAGLNAIESSIQVSKPSLKGTADASQQRQMRQMMMQYGGGKKGREMLEKTKSVSIVQTVTARWELPDDDDLSRMIAAKELTDSISAADIASSSEKQPVSAAQEELAEEMNAMMQENSYGQETVKSGEPAFTYVAKLSSDEYEAAVKAAYEDAESQINSLAKSTNAPVQPIRPLAARLDSGGESDSYGYNRRGVQTQRQPDGSFEMVAASPTEAPCIVSVYALAKHK